MNDFQRTQDFLNSLGIGFDNKVYEYDENIIVIEMDKSHRNVDGHPGLFASMQFEKNTGKFIKIELWE